MRIISWNVFVKNRKIKKGIYYILSLHPDIICLQEVPHAIMPWLATLRGYTVSSCFDWKHRRKSTKHAYVCTLTKQKPIRVRIHQFGPGKIRSIMNTVLYGLILHNIEQHNALVVILKTPVGKLQIANTRLSCASNIISRLEMFHIMIQTIRRKDIPTMYCGDFNVVDSKIFKLFTGWLRGFHIFDYRINERIAFEILFAKERLVNIFRGKSTIFVNRPLLQFDHILVPALFTTQSHTVLRKRYGSDHRVLIADINVSKKIS